MHVAYSDVGAVVVLTLLQMTSFLYSMWEVAVVSSLLLVLVVLGPVAASPVPEAVCLWSEDGGLNWATRDA